MNKKIIFTMFIVVLVAVAGCEQFRLGGKEAPITDVDVRKGTDGITMKFLKNAPPDNVFEGSKENPSIFPIGIELKNKGATNVPADDEGTPEIEGGVLVFGLEKDYVDFDNATKEKIGKKELLKFNIEGKSVYNPVGDDELIKINAKAKEIGGQSETRTSTILATACYPYNTTFGTSICVDTDVYGLRRGRKACSITDLLFPGGQGAPVSVTKIETRMLPHVGGNVDKVKPHFLIFIENKGNGEVISKDKIEYACNSSALNYKDFNTLQIKASLSGIDLVCEVGEKAGPTTIRLRGKEDVVRCTLEEEGGIDMDLDAYTAPLRIELDYGYTFTISKDIIIEKILKY